MTRSPTLEADRRLPVGEEVFLDHVGHFVADRQAAGAALQRAGFAPTPVSIQVTPADAGGGPPRLTGTGNVTCMLERGYLEILFKTADTPLGREFDAAMARHGGVHLAAFAVADADAAHRRLTAAGFGLQPLARMQRPVETAAGEGAEAHGTAAFSVVRPRHGEMPEGRIQALTHHTEHAVWQPRWLSHPNGARGLIDIVIAPRDLDAAAARFRRFLDIAPRPGRFGPAFQLDRGRVQLTDTAALSAIFPRLAVPGLPFIAGYALTVASLPQAAACLEAGAVAFERHGGHLIAAFPPELGAGAFLFAERAADLPWRA